MSSRNAEYVNLKHYMERKIQELEGELACPKQVKLLTREQEALKETGVQTPESQQTAECFYSRLEEENKFNDFVAVKDTWHEELARAAKEKDVMPASVKEAQVSQFKKLKKQIRELQMRHKSLEVELCRREWSHNACLREKDALIRQYQQQLSLAAEQEWILEHSKMQTELDWQQLCENVGSNLYQKSEELTQSLSSAREQVEADPQKTDHRLHEVKTVLSALTAEREQAIHASFNHSTLPEGEKRILQYDGESSLSKEIPNLEIKKLQEQNANLRAAIAQMRKEMESLDEQTLSSHPPTENRQLAEQGSLCTNKISAGTTLSSIKVGSANLDCTENPDTEKVQLDFSIENHGPEQRKADTSSKVVQSQPLRQSPSQAQQVQLSSSTARHFCQGIWQTLQMGSSPSILSPQENTDQVKFAVIHSTERSEESQQNIKAKDKLEMPAADLTVRGTRLEVQQKLKSRNLSCAHPINPKISSNMAKIRNYNIKD